MKSGTLVICIDDTNLPNNFPDYLNEVSVKKDNEISKYGSKAPIKKGNIYLVRRVIKNWSSPDGPQGVALCGFFGKWYLWLHTEKTFLFEELHFRMNRFKEITQEDFPTYFEENDPLIYENVRKDMVLWNNLLIDPHAKEEENTTKNNPPNLWKSITRNTRIYTSEHNIQNMPNFGMQV